MMKTQALLALALLVGACDRDPAQSAAPAPAAAPVALRVEPQPAATPVASIPPARTLSEASEATHEPEPEPRAALDPAGVLDEEERRLLEADDATLTREDRVSRAYAQRKLLMADPEHPLRPVLVAIDEDVASGEYAAMARDMWSGRAAFPEQGQSQAASSQL
jgi:hypothetical protein